MTWAQRPSHPARHRDAGRGTAGDACRAAASPVAGDIAKNGLRFSAGSVAAAALASPVALSPAPPPPVPVRRGDRFTALALTSRRTAREPLG